MYWTPRRAAWAAVVTAGFSVAGVFSGVQAALADLTGQVSFLCTTSTGTEKVDLSVKAAIPASAVVGKPIRLGTVSADLTVPKPLAPVSGQADVQVGVEATQAGRSVDAGWPAFTATASGGPASNGSVHLKGAFEVPEMVAGEAGELSWNAGVLAFGSTARVTCAADKDGVLGRLTVGSAAPAGGTATPGVNPRTASGAARSTGSTGSTGTGAAAADAVSCFEIPGPGVDPKYGYNPDPTLSRVFSDPALPDWAPGYSDTPSDGGRECIKSAGFAEIKKLGDVTPITALGILRRDVNAINANWDDSGFTIDYAEEHGYFTTEVKPVVGTALGFGFMPTTATVRLVQSAPPDNPSGLTTGNERNGLTPWLAWFPEPMQPKIWLRSYVAMGVQSINLNGVAVNVGGKCGTKPTLVNLTGDLGGENVGYQPIDNASFLNGDVVIPKFTNCGTSEDLSPLLTAAISGGGNRATFANGELCPPITPVDECNTPGRDPKSVTVLPGGDATMTAKPFVLTTSDGSTPGITCDSAKVTFPFRRAHWQSWNISDSSRAEFTGCTMATDSGSVPVRVVSDDPWSIRLTQAGSGGDIATMGNMSLRVDGVLGGGRCELTIDGTDSAAIGGFGNPTTYIKQAYVFPLDSDATDPMRAGLKSVPWNLSLSNTTGGALDNGFAVDPASTCPTTVPGFEPASTAHVFPGTWTFDVPQTISIP